MQPDATAAGEVVELCQRLLRIDTTNTGDADTSAGERVAAELVAELLDEVGLTAQIRESAPGRTSVVARFPGADPAREPWWSTAISTWCPPTPRSGGCTRSPASCVTGTSGVAARST